jgi:hypothetical protein
MQPFILGDAATVVSGIIVMLIVIPASLLLGFLLFIAPLMIWLNVRRLRTDIHADLSALRESVERLVGVVSGEGQSGETGDENAAVSPPPVPAEKEGVIGFSCPGCGKFFEGPTTLAGSNYTCSECQVEFHIH